jgi:3-dehydrosphinganine reductase
MTPLHALITGGSSGIGLALAKKLAAKGYDLSLIARRPALLEEAAAALRPHFVRDGQRVLTLAADVADATAAEAAVASAIAQLGTPDLVVTSAGIAIPGYFEEVPTRIYERTMQVNFFGTLYVLRAALPSMRARRRGRIVLVSSGAAFTGIFGYAAYGPTKFAVRGLAETLQSELRADNIAVSVAYPPDTETPQLVEEEKTKPEETKLITSVAATWSAEKVADAILRGIERGAFAITPGATLTLMHRMPGLVIPALRWYCDRLVAGLRRKRLRDGTKPRRAVFSGAEG